MKKIDKLLNNIDEDKYLDNEKPLCENEKEKIFNMTMDKIKNSSKETCNFSKILIRRMQDISDSPRSNREICDLDRFSSAIEHKLTCFPFRTFLSVLPSIDFIKIPAFPTKI